MGKCYNLRMPETPRKADQEVKIGKSHVRVRSTSIPGTQIAVKVTGSKIEDYPSKQMLPPPIGITDNNTPLSFQGWLNLIRQLKLETVLFILAIIIYIGTRFAGLASYPIYFFTDEAVQTVLAEEFIDRGAMGGDGQYFPTYFQNSYQYNLGTSVYLQIVPYLIFGKSIFVTRAASMLVTALAAIWLGLILKRIFGSTHAWLAVLLLSITPAWFLHSRTAFETSLAASLYAGFLYFYLAYRQGDIRKLYLAVFLGALTFYAYSPIRMVVGLTALFLFFSDLKYHFTHRLQVGKAFGLTLLCAIPLLRFQLVHPDETVQHLRVLNSYWIQNISLIEKLALFGKEYLAGFNPLYWFFSNSHDLARHQMNGYGHLLWVMLPFTLLGLGLIFIRFRQPAYRVIFFALLAAPSGAALAKLGITRALVMIIPLTLITTLGLQVLLEKINRHWSNKMRLTNLVVFGLLAGFNLFLCVQSLTVGALWYQDYGLAGMQYGARQLVAAIDDYLEKDPEQKYLSLPPGQMARIPPCASFMKMTRLSRWVQLKVS